MGQYILDLGAANATDAADRLPIAGNALSKLLNADTEPYTHLAATYDPNVKLKGGIDGAGASTIIAEGADSIFNPFYLFRYSKYGDINGGTKGYSSEYHRDVKPVATNILGEANVKDTVKKISEFKKDLQNPSASKIIQWAANDGDRKGGAGIRPIPYQWNDFLWCKWYGKIPNNRLLTLRRYPIPVGDDLKVADQKTPLIPIAQAVTWWGDETGNKLDNVLGMNFGFNWTDRTTAVTDVTGNEISASSLLTSFGVGDKGNLRQVLLATLFSDPNNPFATSGLDAKLQQYVKDSYTKGPYWNRILGPVNIINKTQIRNTGFDFTHSITLNFSYKLRSFNNINPKIAMLDLILNFLALTYNKAEFWGGSNRYFPQPGLILQGLPQTDFENADYFQGIKKVLMSTIQRVQEKAGELAKLSGSLSKVSSVEDLDEALGKLEASSSARAVAGSWVKDLIQGPLAQRALLEGREVGEWHLTVGNPMDPVAVIGNLCMESTKISFSDSLGLDDFPTEINFTVKLSPGRARGKQDIESMFNAGGGDMSLTALPESSSAYNSHGERNVIISNAIRGNAYPDANAKDKATTDFKSQAQISGSADNSTLGQLVANSVPNAKNLANFFRVNVAKMYGDKFAQSNVLTDYFLDFKTKD